MKPVRHRESGFALIETIVLGLLLLVPLLWVLGVLGELHRASLATTAAARAASTDAARALDPAAADAAVREAVAGALSDQGLDPRDVRVRWSSGSALRRGGSVAVEVSYPVTVLQAPILGRVAGPSIWVSATHVTRVDPYRSIE